MDLLLFNQNGIYCPQADVYIDPWRPVDRALITHGHSDHSRYGHKAYLCTESAAPVIRHRLGSIKLQTIKYGQTIQVNGVDFSFHPAGHILGSAQIRVAYKGEVWVASGDYKLENDGLAEAFESVKCHTYITESTFGLPVYKWSDQQEIFDQINAWWQECRDMGKIAVLSGYSLGKAQRIIQGLDPSIGPIFTHTAVENINRIVRAQGISLHETTQVTPKMEKSAFKGGIIVAPPSSVNSPWIKRFPKHSLGLASGWMQLRGARRRRAADRGFILSDHADWIDLNRAIQATEAERVFVTHGYTNIFARWLTEQGYQAEAVETRFVGELTEIGETTEETDKAVE
ncbi:MAG: ligase-associated DNA damage response exonuclease [Bacteroidota bacterium]